MTAAVRMKIYDTTLVLSDVLLKIVKFTWRFTRTFQGSLKEVIYGTQETTAKTL